MISGCGGNDDIKQWILGYSIFRETHIATQNEIEIPNPIPKQ
jgi:hypothetical protein